MKFKMLKDILWLIIVVQFCNCSSIKSAVSEVTEAEAQDINFTEAPQVLSTDAATESVEHFEPASGENSQEPLVENTYSDETRPAMERPGLFFLLRLTIVADYSEAFENRESQAFKNLANNLGSELIDLIDNAFGSNEPNITNFKLVEVLPSRNSAKKVYVTFIISAKKEVNGQILENAISVQLSMYSAIYSHEATDEGFLLKNITKEEAEDYAEEPCGYCEPDFPMMSLQSGNSTIKASPGDDLKISTTDSSKSQSQCNRETIQRGSTSIYIFESQQHCFESVRDGIVKGSDGPHADVENSSEMMGDDPRADVVDAQETSSDETKKCTKSFKRSANEDEIVVVVRKRGDKVFIEI